MNKLETVIGYCQRPSGRFVRTATKNDNRLDSWQRRRKAVRTCRPDGRPCVASLKLGTDYPCPRHHDRLAAFAQQWALWKRLNRSRCRSGCWLGRDQVDAGPESKHVKRQFSWRKEAGPYLPRHVRRSMYSKQLISGSTGAVRVPIGGWGCTLAQPGEHDWTVRVPRTAMPPYVKLLWPLVYFRQHALIFPRA